MGYTIEIFENIYKRYYDKLFSTAYRIIREDEAAHDIVQNAFLNLWESGVMPGNIEAYLTTAVKNSSLSFIKKANSKLRFEKLYPIELSIYESAFDTDKTESIMNAVETLLTDKDKDVINCIFREGLSYKEAAKELNVTVSAINKHIVNALKKLRKHFNITK